MSQDTSNGSGDVMDKSDKEWALFIVSFIVLCLVGCVSKTL